ncbi:MEG-7 [Schistosoma mansoni]|uniref:MEG-7 n=1 Tax=Schistosoma mansoni TaxID=6183 RepID=G4V7W5_SCHMA|nr:MEG-7 [Schistosoma mansoni]|eukprot:XP_018648918.1 MEG-7 [Schistosoma mansoni]
MNTLFRSIFVVVVVYAYFDMANGVPEPPRVPDEDAVPVRAKPATPIKISTDKIPVNKTMKIQTTPSKEKKQKPDPKRYKRSSYQKDKKAKSSSSTLTIGYPILFITTPFVISKFLL